MLFFLFRHHSHYLCPLPHLAKFISSVANCCEPSMPQGKPSNTQRAEQAHEEVSLAFHPCFVHDFHCLLRFAFLSALLCFHVCGSCGSRTHVKRTVSTGCERAPGAQPERLARAARTQLKQPHCETDHGAKVSIIRAQGAVGEHSALHVPLLLKPDGLHVRSIHVMNIW